MAYKSDDLLRLIHTTHALSIWDRSKGPVFWYIAGVPGPFYLNTEKMLGALQAERLLKDIDAGLGSKADPARRAKDLASPILEVFQANHVYQTIVATMIACADETFSKQDYSLIAGGERRDWLFSIPFAKSCGLPHVFLFKNKSVFCEKPPDAGARVLHVCDLINNAASHFELWFPALKAADLQCTGTICVNSRGEGGLSRLKNAGIPALSLNHIDLAFFERSLSSNLITQATFEELACYFASPRDWAIEYLMGRTELFEVATVDAKSFERLRAFFSQDPWSLRNTYPDFFAVMHKSIDERLKMRAAS